MKSETTNLIQNLEIGTVIKMKTKNTYQTTLGVVMNSWQTPEGMKKIYSLESLFDANYKPALYGNAVEVEVA